MKKRIIQITLQKRWLKERINKIKNSAELDLITDKQKLLEKK